MTSVSFISIFSGQLNATPTPIRTPNISQCSLAPAVAALALPILPLRP